MVIITDLLFLTPPELTNIIGQLIDLLYGSIGSFGWTVVMFTFILKAVLLPLEV